MMESVAGKSLRRHVLSRVRFELKECVGIGCWKRDRSCESNGRWPRTVARACVRRKTLFALGGLASVGACERDKKEKRLSVVAAAAAGGRT